MITPSWWILGQFSGRVAGAYVQGSPKGDGAWTVSASSYHGPALAQRFAMRLQLIGNFSLDEFQEAVSVVVEDLKSSKVDSLRNVNIYAGICVQGIETQFMDGDSEIQHMVYDLRRQRQISLSSAKMSEDSLARLKKKSGEEE